MEKFKPREYRDSLAGKIKDAPKEGRREILDEAKNTQEYRMAKENLDNDKILFLERKEFFEKYQNILPEIKNEALLKTKNKSPGGVSIDQELYSDNIAIQLIEKKFRESDKEYPWDLSIGDRLQKILKSDETGWYVDSSKNFSASKEIFVFQSLVSEQTKTKIELKLNESIKKNQKWISLGYLEALSYLGTSPASLEQIKSEILEYGDLILFEKFSNEFSLSLEEKDLMIFANKAFNENSAYDLNEVIKKIPNIDKKFVEKRNSLVEGLKKRFSINKEKIVQGIANKNFLIHFSKRKNLDSIVEHGILSLLAQNKTLGSVQTGEGPDLQRLTGQLNTVSVHNVFKGSESEGSEDTKLFKDLMPEIKKMIQNFQDNYPERVLFKIGHGSGDFIKVDPENRQGYLDKYSKLVEVSVGGYHKYVDPMDRNVGTLTKLVENEKTKEFYISYETGMPSFPDSFFDNIDEQKQQLLDKIKRLMKDCYNKSVSSKKSFDIDEEKLARIFGEYKDYGKENISFILDPNLEKIFVQSYYYRESLISEEITEDKISGIKVTDEYSKKHCFNSGKVAFNVLYEPTESDMLSLDEESIVLKGKSIVIYANSPY